MTSRTTSTPKASVGRTVRTSLAVLAFTCGTTAATYAQTVPAPQAPASATQASSSTTAANPYSVDPAYATSLDPITINAALPQTVAQGPAPAAPPPRPAFGHLPIIDVVADFTQPGVEYNESIYGHTYTNQYHTFDPLDVGGTVRIPITPNFYFAFDRLVGGTLDQATERVIPQATIHAFGVTEGTKGTPIWPAYSRDVVLQYRADELIGKYFALEEGFYFRHRLYANDGSGVSAVPYDCANGKYAAGCTVASTDAAAAV